MSGENILDPPTAQDAVQFRAGFGQRFILTVDTEEEFDWAKPLDRTSHSLVTVPSLRKFQQFCEGFGVVPVYLLDYPVATSSHAAEVLRPAVAEGRAELGVQLHPWVSPPFQEELNEYNSFSGNLPVELEREKFRILRDVIEERFGAPPMIYRAGRYGVGPNSAGILKECGLAIDTSVRTKFDYSYAGGPNFRDHPLHPYWIDRERQLVELPLTTVYWGLLRQLGDWVYPRLWRVPAVRGMLSKLGMLERIALTPEGITIDEAIRGTDIAIDAGLPVLVFSFHSPSLVPGYTPYVQTDEDLDAFYDWWRALFGYLDKRGIAPTSVREIMDSVALA